MKPLSNLAFNSNLRHYKSAGAYDLQQWALRLLKQGGLDPGMDYELYQKLHACLDEAGPGRYCSPRRRMPFNSRDTNSDSMSKTWRVIPR